MNGLTLTIQSPPEIQPEQRLVGPLPTGDAGTEATIAAMVALIREASNGPRVAKLRDSIASPATTFNPLAYAYAVFAWLRRAIKFHVDPPGLEFLRHPEHMLAAYDAGAAAGLKPLGDCDDVADLCGALLLAAGLRPVLVVVAVSADGPFIHVYSGVRQGMGYYAMDPQEMAALGQEVPDPARKRVFDVA